MKTNPANERFESVQFESVQHEADTFGCTIECLPDKIRQRAYQLYEERGFQPGHESEDWLQAEREIKYHLGL